MPTQAPKQFRVQKGPLQQPDWMLGADMNSRFARGGGELGAGGGPVEPGFAGAFGGIPPRPEQYIPSDPNDPDAPDYGRNAGSQGGSNLPQNGPDDWTQWGEWSTMWDALRNGQAGNDVIADIGQRFSRGSGGVEGFRRFLEHPAWRHALAYSMKGTPEWQKMASMEYPTDQILSAGMGQIGKSGQQALRQGMGALQQTGMGRNAGAAAAVQRQNQVETGQAGAQFGAQVGEQAYKAEMGRLNSMLQMEQAMAQISLGQTPNRNEQDQGATAGDWIALLGSLAGGAISAFCWVAREVYGKDDPRWILFRQWMFTCAPGWFFRFYVAHGEQFARLVKRLPWLRRPLRRWMDRRIAGMVGKWTLA